VNLTCDRLRELLYDHHSGELVVEVREEFELHLVQCENCLHLVESYRHTVTVVRKLPRCGLPANVEANLRAKLKEHLDGK
jgi:anti-sigma factor RsiW